MRAVIEKGMQPYLPVLEKRKIELKTLADRATLKLDGELIIRVFSILMDNALDAMPGGGSIMVHGVTNNNHYEIAFSDTGRGISSEDLPFIFNPFFSTKADGAGIDLSVVKTDRRTSRGKHQSPFRRKPGRQIYLEVSPRKTSRHTDFPDLEIKRITMIDIQQPV